MNWDYLAQLDFGFVWQYRYAMLWALGTSLLYLAISMVAGFLLGIAYNLMKRSRLKPLNWASVALTEFFRNTPLLVQLFWIHFALPQFTGYSTSVMQSGMLAMALSSAAYFSEIIRAGLAAVPNGQWEAASAMALPKHTTWLKVILPQALRIVLPPLANTVLGFFKSTAILSVLSVPELMRVTARVSTYSGKPVEMYTVTAVIYVIVGYTIVVSFKLLENRLRIPGH